MKLSELKQLIREQVKLVLEFRIEKNDITWNEESGKMYIPLFSKYHPKIEWFNYTPIGDFLNSDQQNKIFKDLVDLYNVQKELKNINQQKDSDKFKKLMAKRDNDITNLEAYIAGELEKELSYPEIDFVTDTDKFH